MDIFSWNGHQFVQVPGSLEQIAVGDFEGRAVWGINADSDIFKFNPTSGAFEQVPGKLVSISVAGLAVAGNPSVWGINANSDIFTFNSGAFEPVPGKLTSISVGNEDVWGINADSDIFKFNPTSGAFEQVPGKLVSISARLRQVWGINADSDIFKFNPTSGAFEQVPGKLVSINGDGWGLNDANDIFLFGGQQFKQVPGKLISIASFGGIAVWGISPSLEVFTLDATTDGLFQQRPGSLQQIAVDAQGFAWGLV